MHQIDSFAKALAVCQWYPPAALFYTVRAAKLDVIQQHNPYVMLWCAISILLPSQKWCLSGFFMP
jgi:hypothetical protein